MHKTLAYLGLCVLFLQLIHFAILTEHEYGAPLRDHLHNVSERVSTADELVLQVIDGKRVGDAFAEKGAAATTTAAAISKKKE